MVGWGNSKNIHIHWLSLASYNDAVSCTPKKCNGNNKDHWSQIILTDRIIIILKLEIPQTLSKYETNTK